MRRADGLDVGGLAAEWRQRARRLEADAQRCRRDAFVRGPEGAEDAERAALEYRIAASALEDSGRPPDV